MKKHVLSAIVLGAALTMAIGGVSAQAGVKAAKTTVAVTALAAKGSQKVAAKAVTVPKKTNGKKGAVLVKFSISADGYVIPCFAEQADGALTARSYMEGISTGYSAHLSPNSGANYSTSGSSIGVSVGIGESFGTAYNASTGSSDSHSSNTSSNTSHSVSSGISANMSARGNVSVSRNIGISVGGAGTSVTMTVYKDKSCKKVAASILKGLWSGTSMEGAYLKKGTYYMLLTNNGSEDFKANVGVIYAKHKDTVTLKANAFKVGANNKNSSLYKITVPKKGKLTINAYSPVLGKVTLLDSKKKAITSVNTRWGETYISPQLTGANFGKSSNSNKFLSKTVAKGTYYVQIKGAGIHFVKYTFK